MMKEDSAQGIMILEMTKTPGWQVLEKEIKDFIFRINGGVSEEGKIYIGDLDGLNMPEGDLRYNLGRRDALIELLKNIQVRVNESNPETKHVKVSKDGSKFNTYDKEKRYGR